MGDYNSLQFMLWTRFCRGSPAYHRLSGCLVSSACARLLLLCGRLCEESRLAQQVQEMTSKAGHDSSETFVSSIPVARCERTSRNRDSAQPFDHRDRPSEASEWALFPLHL